MRFRSTLLLSGKTATGIPVPDEVIEGLGAGKRPAVRVTLNGFTYRTTVGSVDGKPMLPVSAEIRDRAGVRAGDAVDIDIDLDTDPREVTLPPDFAEALGRDDAARQYFDGLSRSNKQRLVLPVEQAKTSETRQRRIDAALSALRERRI